MLKVVLVLSLVLGSTVGFASGPKIKEALIQVELELQNLDALLKLRGTIENITLPTSDPVETSEIHGRTAVKQAQYNLLSAYSDFLLDVIAYSDNTRKVVPVHSCVVFESQIAQGSVLYKEGDKALGFSNDQAAADLALVLKSITALDTKICGGWFTTARQISNRFQELAKQ